MYKLRPEVTVEQFLEATYGVTKNLGIYIPRANQLIGLMREGVTITERSYDEVTLVTAEGYTRVYKTERLHELFVKEED